jgi:polyphosphate kinase 2 (PPK2 family)
MPEEKNDHPTADGDLKRKEYERELARLHVEFVKLQQWVVHAGLKYCIISKAATGGKGGTIKAITEQVSPRIFQVVALPAPTEREKVADVRSALHSLPAAGEIVISTAADTTAPASNGVGFLHRDQAKRFLRWFLRSKRSYETDILLK